MLCVREIPEGEAESLQRLMNLTRDPAVMRRCQVVSHSMQGFSPPKLASMVFWSEEWVRRVITDLNRTGRDALIPARPGGRPPKFTAPLRRAMVDVALASPSDHGFAFGPWTLDRLRDGLVMEGWWRRSPRSGSERSSARSR